MCVDYRALNRITIKNRYPLPRIDSGSGLLKSLWQMRITETYQPKTAFRMPFGHFEWKVLPMGLTNAPAPFQSTMSRILGHLPFVSLLMDDLSISSRSGDEHLGHIRQVLQIMRDNRFVCNRKKCEFFKTHLEFLGHLITPEGIALTPAKSSRWPSGQCPRIPPHYALFGG
jgi:hypothetical protein